MYIYIYIMVTITAPFSAAQNSARTEERTEIADGQTSGIGDSGIFRTKSAV